MSTYTYTYVKPNGKYLVIDTSVKSDRTASHFYCSMSLNDVIFLKYFDNVEELQDMIAKGKVKYESTNKNANETIKSSDFVNLSSQRKKMFLFLTGFPELSIKMNFVPPHDYNCMKNREMNELIDFYYQRPDHNVVFSKKSRTKDTCDTSKQLALENAKMTAKIAQLEIDLKYAQNKNINLNSLNAVNFSYNEVLVDENNNLSRENKRLKSSNDKLQLLDMRTKRKIIYVDSDDDVICSSVDDKKTKA
jgi:hypothetical protein